MKKSKKKEILRINNKSRFSCAIFLYMILSISLCIICYVVGKYSWSNIGGDIIDTIIIEEPQNTSKLPVYLTGKVSYSDGTSYQGGIKLYSNAQETKTDKNGIFFFQNLIYGKQSLLVVDDNANVIAELKLTINQSTATDRIMINKIGSEYKVSVGINNALIEINIELDKKEINLKEKDMTVVGYGGRVVTPNKTTTMRKNIVETFNGNKVMPEGIIVLPNIGVILSNGTFIASSGQINYSEGITELPSGLKVEKNGIITLQDETIIKPDGTIIRPETKKPKPVTGDDSEEEENPISPEEPDPLTWDVPIIKQGNMRWDQLTTIDLFASNDSKLEGKIYPGVSGEYEFSIENINPYNVLFRIDMEEQEHEAGSINLSYRLKYYNSELNRYVYVIGDSNNYLKPSELSTTDKVLLLANSKVNYILEWIWDNENNEEQDLKDGKLGANNNRVHFIDMIIYTENE